jgi:hypothetical protein
MAEMITAVSTMATKMMTGAIRGFFPVGGLGGGVGGGSGSVCVPHL